MNRIKELTELEWIWNVFLFYNNFEFGCDTSSMRFPTKMLLASVESIFLFANQIGTRGAFSLSIYKRTVASEISKEPKKQQLNIVRAYVHDEFARRALHILIVYALLQMMNLYGYWVCEAKNGFVAMRCDGVLSGTVSSWILWNLCVYST